MPPILSCLTLVFSFSLWYVDTKRIFTSANSPLPVFVERPSFLYSAITEITFNSNTKTFETPPGRYLTTAVQAQSLTIPKAIWSLLDIIVNTDWKTLCRSIDNDLLDVEQLIYAVKPDLPRQYSNV